ncbi:uncharacterized protein DS421_4g108930 [Arachis hypogaea]|nr:uncharacterized protein DS421_4g108930 [Arachis hypogaea]
MGDDPKRLYRLDGVAHITRVINDECSYTLVMYYKSVTLFISHNTHVKCRWSGYNSSGSEKGPRVQMWRLMIDMLQDKDFIWMPYSSPEVLQVVHPETLESQHTAMWRSVTSLIYFAVIKRTREAVIVGSRPLCSSGISIGRTVWTTLSGSMLLQTLDRHMTSWTGGVSIERGSCHQRCIWKIREPFLFLWRRHRRVLDEFLTWIVLTTCRIGVGSRGELVWGHDGASVSGGGWTRLWTRLTAAVDVEEEDEGTEGDGEGVLRRRSTVIMVTTMTTISTGPWGVAAGHVVVGGVSPHVGGHGGEWYGLGMGDRADPGDGGLGSGPFRDYFIGVPADDQTLQESTPWVSPGSMFSDFLALMRTSAGHTF